MSLEERIFTILVRMMGEKEGELERNLDGAEGSNPDSEREALPLPQLCYTLDDLLTSHPVGYADGFGLVVTPRRLRVRGPLLEPCGVDDGNYEVLASGTLVRE